VLRDADRAVEFLRTQHDVGDIEVKDRDLVVHFPSDEDAQADLLGRMLAAGVAVVGFRSRQENLEDVFMAITKGKVQ
jgi:hypothetical protein